MIDVATPTARGRRSSPRRRRPRAGTGRRSRCSTATRCGPRSTRPPTSAGCGTAPGGALVDPARLAWGLRDAALSDGVRIHEHTRVTRLRRTATAWCSRPRAAASALGACSLRPTPTGRSCASIRRYVVPVYDYVLVTEPLSEEQRRAIGWQRRQGLADSGNRFHYYRLTPDEPHPLGRLRGDLPLPERHAAGARGSRTHLRAPRAATSPPPSPSSRASGSRTGGPARSTPAAASA